MLQLNDYEIIVLFSSLFKAGPPNISTSPKIRCPCLRIKMEGGREKVVLTCLKIEINKPEIQEILKTDQKCSKLYKDFF